MKVIALFVLITVAALAPFLYWLARRRDTLTPEDVAAAIEAFLSGSGSRYDWDDFTSFAINDPSLDAIRVRCLGLPEEFPSLTSNQYCSEAGLAVLRSYVTELRRGGQPSVPS